MFFLKTKKASRGFPSLPFIFLNSPRIGSLPFPYTLRLSKQLLGMKPKLEHVTSVTHYAELISIGRTSVIGVQANGEVLTVLSVKTEGSTIGEAIKSLRSEVYSTGTNEGSVELSIGIASVGS